MNKPLLGKNFELLQSKWKTDITDSDIEYTLDNTNFLNEIRENGKFEIVEPDDFTLLLDIDDIIHFEIYERVLGNLLRHIELQENPVIYFSISGPPKCHVILKLHLPLSVEERIALQAILGSDPIKELYSLLRVRQGIKCPVFLLRQKEDSR